jgi:hypothetical protein
MRPSGPIIIIVSRVASTVVRHSLATFKSCSRDTRAAPRLRAAALGAALAFELLRVRRGVFAVVMVEPVEGRRSVLLSRVDDRGSAGKEKT